VNNGLNFRLVREFVGDLAGSGGMLTEVALKLATGGIKRPLLLLGAGTIDQQSAIIVNHIEENLFDVFLSQRRGFV
jgi:hypothetical protein